MKLFRPNAEFACCSSLSLCSVLERSALRLIALAGAGYRLYRPQGCSCALFHTAAYFASLGSLSSRWLQASIQTRRLASRSLVCLSLEFDLSSIPPLCYEPNSSACAPTKAIRHNIELSNAGKRRDPQKWQSDSIFHCLLSSIPISLAS